MGLEPTRRAAGQLNNEEMKVIQNGVSVPGLKNHLMTLQLHELLKSTKVPYGKQKTLDTTLHAIHSILSSLPSSQVSEDCLQMKGMRLKNHIKRKEIVLAFEKPSKMDVVGSHLIQTGTKMDFNIDFAIEMPSSCFLPKDFQNFRYFDKRVLYLGVLAAALKEHPELFSKVTLENSTGDRHKPVLVLEPIYTVKESKHGKCHKIRLHPVISTEVFKSAKLLPDRGNIQNPNHNNIDDSIKQASPYYNNGIIQDMYMRQHLRELHTYTRDCPAFVDVIVLSKIWIRQRGFHLMEDSVNGFVMSMVLVYLMETHRMNRQMSSLQMFKILMHFLGTETSSGNVLKLGEPAENSTLFTCFAWTFLDRSGQCNLTAHMTSSAVIELREECIRSSQLLKDGSIESVQHLFVAKSSFWTRYDEYIWIPAPPKSSTDLDAMLSVTEQYQMYNHGIEKFWKSKIVDIVGKALTDRILLIRPCVDLSSSPLTWNCTDAPCGPRRIVLGLSLDQEKYGRMVDKGPAADDTANAAKYRTFWKGKSELRRFKDGTILEAAVWQVPFSRRHEIVEAIVKYILPAHIPHLDGSNITAALGGLYANLSAVTTLPSAECTLKVWNAFQSLSQDLNKLKTLPLAVKSCMAADAAFRYSNLHPTTAHPMAISSHQSVPTLTGAKNPSVSLVIDPIHVVIELEKSSKWPADITAVHNLRIAFLVYIAQEMISNGYKCDVCREFIDVYSNGYVFRLTLFCEKEMQLLTSERESWEMHLHHVASVKHGAFTHALHSTYTNFGPTVRMATVWLESCNLCHHVPHEVIECIVASLFLTPSQSKRPTSVLAGFMQFLKTLYRSDWQNVPLIVDFERDMSDDTRREIVKDFHVARKNETGPAMYIVSHHEEIGFRSGWTQQKPEGIILQRLCAEAQLAFNNLEAWLSTGCSSVNLAHVFRANFAGYNAVLELSPSYLPAKHLRPEEAVQHTSASLPFRAPYFKNSSSSKSSELLIGFDPMASYLQKLEDHFGGIALFFASPVSPGRIYIVWRQATKVVNKFQVMKSRWMTPVEKTISGISSKVGEFQVEQVLNEMEELGMGIVHDVHLIEE